MSVALPSILLCVAMFVAQTGTKANPRESAEEAIGEAIRLIEAKDYKTFLVWFAPPELVKARGDSPEALAAWVEEFSQRADNLLAAFQYARTQTPSYDKTKTTATFPLKGDVGPTTLRMVKIGQYWYLGDK